MIRSIRNSANQHGAIAQRLLGDTVFDRLLADIIAGRFTPHERLKVDAIAYELSVSRTPVREAITRLAWSGFVDVARNSHTQIAEWNATDMRDRLAMSGELVGIGLDDPRLDLSRLRLGSMPPEHIRHTPDTRVYLDLVEDIAAAPWSCAVTRVLDELHRPLRLYICSPLLPAHGVNLGAQDPERSEPLVSLARSLTEGDRRGANEYLSLYLERLIPLF